VPKINIQQEKDIIKINQTMSLLKRKEMKKENYEVSMVVVDYKNNVNVKEKTKEDVINNYEKHKKDFPKYVTSSYILNKRKLKITYLFII
jgi:hypothetical protein